MKHLKSVSFRTILTTRIVCDNEFFILLTLNHHQTRSHQSYKPSYIIMVSLSGTLDSIGWVQKSFRLTPSCLDLNEVEVPLSDVIDVSDPLESLSGTNSR